MKMAKFISNPLYRNFVSKPSDRQIVDYYSKAGKDTVNVLVLKVEFLEDTSSMTTGNGKMDVRGSLDSEFVYDSTEAAYVRNLYYQPPHDSLYFYRQMEALRNYYLDDSRGKLYIDFGIYPKGLYATYTMKHSMLYYGDTLNMVAGLFNLLKDALKEAEVEGGVDFSRYDCVIVFHAGSMWQTDYNGDSPFDLAAVYALGADAVFGEQITVGGKSFNDGIIYSETGNQDGGYAFIQGGLVHEFGHQLGLYDLYDVSGVTMGMGGWAVHGTGNWNLNGMVPPHHAGYNAAAAFNANPNSDYSSWIYFNQTMEIANDTQNVKVKYLGSNEDTSVKLVKIPINAYEYYLIENRFVYQNPDTLSDDPDSNGFRVWKDGVLVKVDDYDISLPPDIGSGGLAIYHIDRERIEADSGMNEFNVWPNYAVDMEEADMVQDFQTDFYDVTDLEKAFYGSPYDLFFKGSVNDMFTPKTIPNTCENNSGNSHIYIYNISPADTVMTFSVLYDYKTKGFPFYMKSSPDVNSPVVTEIGGRKIIFLQTVGGEIYAVDSEGNGAFNENGIVAIYSSDNESYSTPAFGSIRYPGSNDMVVTSYSGEVSIARTDTLNVRDMFVSVKGSPYTAGDGIVSSAVLGDIDGDSLDEILFTSEDMFLHILEYSDSIVEKDFSPIYLGAESWSMPIVLKDRIIVLGSDGVVRGYSFTGESLFASNTENIEYTSSSPLAADIDKDGDEEIIFVRGDGSVLSVSSQNGDEEFAKKLPESTFYSSCSAADIDGDGEIEIVLFMENILYVISRYGNIKNGYPVEMKFASNIQSSPLLADINGDSIPDIVYLTPNGRLEAQSKSIKPGFPIGVGKHSNSTPVFSDLDSDGKIELIAAADSTIYSYSLNSSGIEGGWMMMNLNTKNNRLYEYSPQSVPDTSLLKGTNLYIYPNPCTNSFRLRFETYSGEQWSYKIFDISGALKASSSVMTPKTGVNEYDISVYDMAAGMYVLVLTIEGGGGREIRKMKFTVRK